MKKIILFLVFLIANLAVAQEVHSTATGDRPGLSESDLTIAKALYIKMISSEQYLKHNELSSAFLSMLPKDLDLTTVKSEEAFRAAITEKIMDSKFKSVDDAMDWMHKVISSQTTMEADNREVFRLMGLADKKQFREIVKPELDRVRREAGF